MGKKKERSVPPINAGSMADIAFLLLIFFIVATTMDTDSGILTKLPPMPEEDQEPPPDINDRNVLEVLVNAQDQLLVEGEWKDVTELREITVEFITNPGGREDLPESPTKAVVSLQNDRGTSYNTYIQVQNELKAAYNQIRDEESRRMFGMVFSELEKDQRKEVQKKYPIKVSEAEPKDLGGDN
jgi:biopolymer transport protein ExbD